MRFFFLVAVCAAAAAEEEEGNSKKNEEGEAFVTSMWTAIFRHANTKKCDRGA